MLVKIVSEEALMSALHERSKYAQIVKVFEDAYKSPLRIIIYIYIYIKAESSHGRA